MADILPEFEDGDLGWDLDAKIELGTKIIEMFDRLKTVHRCCPGARASWVVEIDGTTYRVAVDIEQTVT